MGITAIAGVASSLISKLEHIHSKAKSAGAMATSSASSTDATNVSARLSFSVSFNR